MDQNNEKMNSALYNKFLDILHDELRPAMGCTEPISIAYAAALMRKYLCDIPEKVILTVSGSVIKNAMAVIVPNTGGRKGIKVACAAGIVAGDPEEDLQVLAHISDEDIRSIDAYLAEDRIDIVPYQGSHIFDIIVKGIKDKHTVTVRIVDRHTQVAKIQKDDEFIYRADCDDSGETVTEEENDLSVESIYRFAKEVDISAVHDLIMNQVNCNMAICREGLEHDWGCSIGSLILNNQYRYVRTRAKAMAAAGSDARMSGCEMPVVINSGSGNQGITVSAPVIVYAEEYGKSEEELIRALVLSNLLAIHIKSHMGSLSAYCGAISAGCACGAGIAFLLGGDLNIINHTIVNALAILSGTACDGAKPSCAAKIAMAVDAGIMGYEMILANKEFRDGEGLIKKGVENTIRNIIYLGKYGMKDMNDEILKLMIN